MTFKQLAFKNISRNARIYVAYFFSNLFTVTLFFAFAALAFHPALQGTQQAASQALSASAIVIFIFSFVYVSYSMSSFTNSRKKEFGILMVNGLSPKQLRSMLVQENFLIGFLADILGIILGLPVTWLLLMLGKSALHLDLPMYLPVKAILITSIMFLLLFLIASFMTFRKMTKNDLSAYLRYDKVKLPPKTRTWVAILSILMIIIGYAVALSAQGTLVIAVLLPVMFLVIVGTKLFLDQGLVFLARLSTKRKKTFYRKTNLITLSELSYRVRDNSKTFFFISIITTVVFASLGTLFSFYSLAMVGLGESNYEYSYKAYTPENPQFETITTTLHQADATSRSIEGAPIQIATNDTMASFISETEYNQFAQFNNGSTVDVADNESVWVWSASYVTAMSQLGSSQDLTDIFTSDRALPELQLHNRETLKNNYIPELNDCFIVSDSTYQKLMEKSDSTLRIGATTNSLSYDENVQVGMGLLETLNADDDEFIGFSPDKAVQQTILNVFGIAMFIGLFIGIIFFISAGSFLYFRLYTDLDEDITKFKRLNRIGITPKEISRIVFTQTAFLFGIPLLLATTHGLVALKAMAGIFEMFFIPAAGYVVLAFVVIQIIYFIISYLLYNRRINKAVFA